MRKREIPFTPAGAPLDSPQDHMHNVVDSIMIACGYEDLLAMDQVITLSCRLAGCRYVGQGTSGLGLCKGHRSLPLTGKHFGGILFNHLLCTK